MKKNKALLVLLIVLFVTISIISIVHFYYTTLGVKDYPIIVKVGQKIGIDVGTDMIRFGGIQPGGGSKRIFHIHNKNPIDVRIKLLAFGQLKKYISYSDNNFIMKPNETKTVDVSLGVPKDMPYGNYTGTLRVIIKRA